MPAHANGRREQPSARTPLRARPARSGRPKRVSTTSSPWERSQAARGSLGEPQETQDAISSPAMVAHEVKRRVSALRVAAEAAGVLQRRAATPRPRRDRLLAGIPEL